MAKANGIVFNNTIIGDKIQIEITVSVVTPGNPNLSAKFNSAILITGSENAQQLNTALANAIKTDALVYGITLLDSDISTTKFS